MISVVTGASSGLGAAFARRLDGPIVLVARRAERLTALAAQLADARTLPADLATAGGRAEVAAVLREEPVRTLVCAAGFGAFGPFEEIPCELQREMVEVNLLAPLELVHAAIPGMIRRGGGAIVLVSSTSAFQATPWLTTYGASKAFVLSLSDGLAVELKRHGITVLGVAPGPTRTEWAERAGVDGQPPAFLRADPDAVAAAALARLGRRSLVVPGIMNRIGVTLATCLPRSWTARLAGDTMIRLSQRLRDRLGRS